MAIQQNNNLTSTYEKISLGTFGVLFCTTILAGLIITNYHKASAETTKTTSDEVTISVSSACTLSASLTEAHSAIVNPGQYSNEEGIGTTAMTAVCNDSEGYAIYAVGYSADTWKNTNLIGEHGNIATATKGSTTDSHWYMKLLEGDGNTATIESPYNDFTAVPDDYIKVASYNATTNGKAGSSFKTTYGAYVATNQTADTYTGKVKYTLVNPRSAAAPEARDLTFDEAFAAASKSKSGEYYKMQDMSSAICASIEPEQTTSLMDIRDNQIYTVAKLADNRCWMTSNLNLPGGTTLNPDTSNVPTNSYYVLPSSASTSNDGVTLTDSSQFSEKTGEYVYNTQNKTTNQNDCTSDKPCNSYYSWLVATAGGKDADGNDVTSNGGDTAYSICPKGWKLPSSGRYTDSDNNSILGYKKGDFYKLLVAYGMNGNSYQANEGTTPTGSSIYAVISGGTIPNFLLTGYYVNGEYNKGGDTGAYWASSALGQPRGYSMRLRTDVVSSAGSGNPGERQYGHQVRCISDK